MPIGIPIGRKKFKELELKLALKYPPRTKKSSVDLIAISEATKINYPTLYAQWSRGRDMNIEFLDRLEKLLKKEKILI